MGAPGLAMDSGLDGASVARGFWYDRPMKLACLALALAPAAAIAAGPEHFDVMAAFVPASKPGGLAAIAVTFVPKDPEVHINQEPAPRLKLDPLQTVLVDKQPPAQSRVPAFDPETAKYLDTALPVNFPVAWASKAPKQPQTVKASVTYFYCSKREGWCRKGSTPLELSVP